MKVNELFEAAQGAPGQGGKLRGGAFYSPGYDEDTKMLRGSVLDWMDSAGITADDIAQAVEQIKKDPLIAQLRQANLDLVHKPASEKRGTLTFETGRIYPKSGSPKKVWKLQYSVYANGQIRYTSDSIYATHQGKLKSPKPRFKAGDPVGSLLLIYRQALKELLAKAEKVNYDKNDNKVNVSLGK